MTGILYFNKSDKRYLRKNIEEISTISVEFIEDSSIVNPRLKLTVDSKIFESNYIWLNDFHRYYYINNIIVSNGYVYADCHVDVLMTYSKEIKEIECIVRRNENYKRCNFYQNDDKRKLNSYPCTRVLEFDKNKGFDMTKCNFVMGVVGDV